jgi:hypothetical protein
MLSSSTKYIDQSVNMGVRLFSFNTSSINQHIADWSFENMNTDVKPYGMSLGVSVSNQDCHKEHVNGLS